MSYRKGSSASCDDVLEISAGCKNKEEVEEAKKTGKRKPRCKLDANGCLNLKDVLLSFNGPVSQEQAWALCYQTAKSLSQLSDKNFCEFSDLSDIVLHKDGNVCLDDLTENRSRPAVSEQKVIFSLGMMIFKALDFGLGEEEERPLSPDLEALITSMTNADQENMGQTEDRPQETDDEGIERDSGDGDIDEFSLLKNTGSCEEILSLYSLKNVMQMCTRHVQTTIDSAEAHYKAVIRAFVAEALELSQFLETVAAEKLDVSGNTLETGSDGNKQCSTSLQHLDALDFNDWARFWVQVIQELRRGVKLKKVDASLGSKTTSRGRGRGAEFELTPYEILMDDIRERRYHLRKTPSPTPHVRKDAHAVILEFIRSRPPLKKASDRKLPPLQKESTLRELLMESIKKPQFLRPSRSRHVPKHEQALQRIGGEARMIVLGEVPPSQPEQEQEPAQDVAAQFLQSEEQTNGTSTSTAIGNTAPAAPGRNRSSVPPVPQPRQRIGKPEIRIPGNRNRKSRRRRITAADRSQNSAEVKEDQSLTAPKPPRRNLEAGSTAERQRKVIPVDFDLKLDAEDEDDDEEYNEEFNVTRFEEEDEATNFWQLKEDYSFGVRDSALNRHRCPDDDEPGSANPWRRTGGLRLTKNEYHRFCDTQLESYDLATQCPSRRASARKHAAKRHLAPTTVTGTTSLPHSRPQSRQHTVVTASSQGPSPNISLNPSPSLSPQPRVRQPRRSHTIAEGTKDAGEEPQEWQEESEQQRPSLGDMFLDERLSLTLEEIVHIRSVLTKAELESLPVEGRVKEDVEKRRVCFLCLKTRFGLLGPWGQRCRLCERTVCVKCYSKMRIPTEHFAHVPVVLLSPGLLLSPSSSEPDTSSKNSWLRGNGAAGSAPASPASRRKDSSLRSATPASTPTTTPVLILTPTSTPPSHARRETENQDKKIYKTSGSPAGAFTPKAFPSFAGQSTDHRLTSERLRGVAMVVCHDCRIMVIQIIKSSRTTRATIRNNVISRLTLNLSPAYV